MNKQLIPNLGRIIGKAVIVAALACPFVFTSCVEFDDSELKESIKDLYEKISALEERVTNEVAALTAIINGKVTVVAVTPNNDGSTVVTLSDGKSFTVGANVTGASFLTTVEEGGVLYWAVTVVGGKTEPLQVDGKKVPVTVTPAVKLENGEWMVSVDGGNTWVSTGIQQEEEVVFFTSVSDDEDYVYITLAANGETVKVAKEKEVSFAVLSGKQYFTAGETKDIKLQMKGVKDYTITEKPDGWKASIVDGKLKVTAPSTSENVDSEGTIKILATFENASPVIGKVFVSIGEADFTITLEGENVAFTLAASNVDNDSYQGYVTGIMPYSQYSAEAAIEYFDANFKYGCEYYNSVTTTISALAGDAYNPDESYVVFAANYKNSYWDGPYSAEDIQYVVYSPVKINVILTPSLDNATVKVTFSGCEGFYAGCDNKSYFDPENYLYDLGSSWGPELCKEPYEGPAGLICGGWSQTLQMGTEYVFWLVPYDESGNYTVDSFQIYEFSTKSLSLGGSFAKPEISLTQDPTYDQVAAQITVVKGAYKTYAKIFTKDEVPADELEFVQKLVAQGVGKTDADDNFRVNRTWLDPGTEVVVAAVAIGNDGAAGEVATFETSTQKLLYTDNLKVTPEVVTLGMTDVKIKLNLEGAVTSVRYVNTYDTYGVDTMEDKLAQKSRYDLVTVEVASLTDNTIELTDLTLGKEYTFYAMAEDAEGNLSHMGKVTYTPSSDIVYIKKDSGAEWDYGKPSISGETWGPEPWVWVVNEWVPSRTGWYAQSTTLDVDLTVPAECKKVYCLVDYAEYHTAKTELSMSDWVVAKGVLYTESTHIQVESANESTCIWLVWVDSNDKYHTYELYTPTFPDKPTEPPTTKGE
ncbi:MAG: PL29 family lyase N-terminal domain-containing protein [Candidatus Cryptobacteroides sp.]|nr:PL29 family lyase N-terminal domain-containing protein [Candidatus Cryptobacteroides sp.]